MFDEPQLPVLYSRPMSKALIVGCSGFLGRYLAETLLEAGDEVDGVDTAQGEHLPKGLRVLPASEISRIEPAHDVVYIVAAVIPYGAYDQPDERMLESNVRLVDQIHRHWPAARIVYASSVAVHGSAPGPLSEELVTCKPTLYGLSKLAGELVARHHGSHAIIRFTSLCGRGMTDKTFLPRIVNQARRNKTIALWGDGLRLQDYVHVRDAALYCYHAARSDKNGVFLGAQGASVSNLEAAQHVQSLLPGTAITFEGVDTSPSFVYDPSRTWAQLGFRPGRSAFQALSELIEHG